MTTRKVSAARRQVSDAAVAAAAAHAIHVDRAIPGGVHVTVDHGNATITGTVHFAYEKAEAEDVVRHVSGVRDVVNEVVVRAGIEPVDDCC